MKVLTFSGHFPKGHPKSGRPTDFVEKILYSLYQQKIYSKSKCVEMARETGIDDDHPMCFIDTFSWYDCVMPKGHTIRTGSRFSPGDMASLRVWSGAPYRSKQIEFAQVEVKKVWEVQIVLSEGWWAAFINGKFIRDIKPLAINDGLTLDDFTDWFAIHPKKSGALFTGQIICWSNEINY